MEHGKIFQITDIVEYIPNSIFIKSIIKNTTGNVNALSFDKDETLKNKITPFNTLIQIIDGNAEIIIGDTSYLIKTGESIIIPPHTRNTLIANVRFKMLSTIIKTGYEDLSL